MTAGQLAALLAAHAEVESVLNGERSGASTGVAPLTRRLREIMDDPDKLRAGRLFRALGALGEGMALLRNEPVRLGEAP